MVVVLGHLADALLHADLRISWLAVDQHAACGIGGLFEPGSMRAQIQKEVRLLECVLNLASGLPVVVSLVIYVAPPVIKSEAFQQRDRCLQPIGVVVTGARLMWVVTRVGIVAFLDKNNLVPQSLQTEQPLEAPGHHATQRVAHHVGADDDERHSFQAGLVRRITMILQVVKKGFFLCVKNFPGSLGTGGCLATSFIGPAEFVGLL